MCDRTTGERQRERESVCVRERKRECQRERERECVRESEREIKKQRDRERERQRENGRAREMCMRKNATLNPETATAADAGTQATTPRRWRGGEREGDRVGKRERERESLSV